MEKTYKDALSDLLEIINYQGDREKFVDEFLNLNQKEALVNLIEKLPEETKMELENSSDPLLLEKYISKEEIAEEYTKVSAKALAKFIEAVSSTLNDTQKDKISNLLLEKAD